jgi:hypothetical protein
MKALLTAIKSQLQTSLTYIRDRDIYITPHANYIPYAVRPPCVGIKDGTVKRVWEVRDAYTMLMSVSINVFVQLAKDEAAVMGDTSTSKKGVLDIIADIRTALDDNVLSISGMQVARSPQDVASELFGDERNTLQRKTITYEYQKQVIE